MKPLKRIFKKDDSRRISSFIKKKITILSIKFQVKVSEFSFENFREKVRIFNIGLFERKLNFWKEWFLKKLIFLQKKITLCSSNQSQIKISEFPLKNLKTFVKTLESLKIEIEFLKQLFSEKNNSLFFQSKSNQSFRISCWKLENFRIFKNWRKVEFLIIFKEINFFTEKDNSLFFQSKSNQSFRI